MKILYNIDTFLLKCFQQMSDLLQTWIGVTNFTLARACTSCLAILYTASYCVHPNGFIAGVHVVIIFALTLIIKKGEQSVRMTGDAVMSNVMVLETRHLRIIYVFASFFGAARNIEILFFEVHTQTTEYVFLDVSNLLLVSILYFAACTPKPPSKSKLRKMLASLGTAVQSMVPQPEPCPVRVRS